MKTEAQKRATRKYDKEHSRQILLKLNKKTDADILAKFDAVPNMQGYVKTLIREDLKVHPLETSANEQTNVKTE